MNVNRGWLWAAFVAVIALVLVGTLVVDPTVRAALSIVAIAPLLISSRAEWQGVSSNERRTRKGGSVNCAA